MQTDLLPSASIKTLDVTNTRMQATVTSMSYHPLNTPQMMNIHLPVGHTSPDVQPLNQQPISYKESTQLRT